MQLMLWLSSLPLVLLALDGHGRWHWCFKQFYERLAPYRLVDVVLHLRQRFLEGWRAVWEFADEFVALFADQCFEWLANILLEIESKTGLIIGHHVAI